MNLYEALVDENLFQPWFAGPSWEGWRTVVKGVCGLPLGREERKFFGVVAERDPPKSPVSELWCIAGRRAGKDSIASAVGAHAAAVPNYQPYVRPGEQPLVSCFANERAQAKIVLNYTRAFFTKIPLLASMKTNSERKDGFVLSNDVELSVVTANYRVARGRPIAAAILDECAFYQSEESANPDTELYTAITPGMATMPNPMLLGISTPYRKSGLLYEKFKAHFGKEDQGVLVIRAPSMILNPTLNPAIIEAAMERDPVAAASEWMADWRSDIDSYIDREAIEALVVPGRRELPRMPGVTFAGYSDAAGGSGQDSFTSAVACLDRPSGKVLLCATREQRPPFSPAATIAEHAAFFRSYGVTRIKSDRFAGQFPIELFKQAGVICEPSELTTSDVYRETLGMLNSGQIELLDDKRLISQICSLERRTSRSGGKDVISHPAGNFHDDLAASALGAIVNARHASGMTTENMQRALAAMRPSARPSRYAWRGASRSKIPTFLL
jgi:hypothetical protein